MYVYVMIRNAHLIIGLFLDGAVRCISKQKDDAPLYHQIREMICTWKEFPLPKKQVDGPIGEVAGFDPFMSLLRHVGMEFPGHWPKALLKATEVEAKSLFIEDRDWFVPTLLSEKLTDGMDTNPEVWANPYGEKFQLEENGAEVNTVLDKFTEWMAGSLDLEVKPHELQKMDDLGALLDQYGKLVNGRSKHTALFDMLTGWLNGEPHLPVKVDEDGREFLTDSRGNDRYLDKAGDLLLLYCTIIDYNMITQREAVRIPYVLIKYWKYVKEQLQLKAVDEITRFDKNAPVVKSHAFKKRRNFVSCFLTKEQKAEIEEHFAN